MSVSSFLHCFFKLVIGGSVASVKIYNNLVMTK